MSLDIAIIGYSCRLPGADNAKIYWKNIQEGSSQIKEFSVADAEQAGTVPEITTHLNYVGRHGCINDIENFDADFFGITAVEAIALDPQQRLFLQSCWEALEHAAYCPVTYPGLIGLFAGCGLNQYLFNVLLKNKNIIDKLGAYTLMQLNDKDFLSTRTAFKLNLRGPAITVQTACSTSLVAIHQACQSIICGDSDIAIAGGVSIAVPQMQGYVYQEGMILSKDGICRPFDENANGTVIGSGVVTVVLKSLLEAEEDGDYVHAVIKGSAINNDGSDKSGYTAPSVTGQRVVIQEALENANISATEIDYVETHGTATKLGDPIEFQALKQAFEIHTETKQFCKLSSVKATIGHVDTAAGCAGFLKAVLALSNKVIPGMANFTKSNPHIDLENSPFTIDQDSQVWHKKVGRRLAGVSSFGIGGTNAHVILEEAPEKAYVPSNKEGVHKKFILLSATDADDMASVVTNLKHHLIENPNLNLSDVAYSLRVGRKNLATRCVLACSNIEGLIENLDHYLAKNIKPLIQSIDDKNTFQLKLNQFLEENTDCLTAHDNSAIDNLTPILKAHNIVKENVVSGIDQAEQLEWMLIQLWLSGVNIPWFFCYQQGVFLRLPLPTYPFKKNRYWADNVSTAYPGVPQEQKQPIKNWFYRKLWEPQTLPKTAEKANDDAITTLLVFYHSSDSFAQSFISSINETTCNLYTVELSSKFSISENKKYQIDESSSDDYKKIFSEISEPTLTSLVFFNSQKMKSERSIVSLLLLSQAIVNTRSSSKTNIILAGDSLLTSVVMKNDGFEHVMLPNIVISLSQENPSISYRFIEFTASKADINNDYYRQCSKMIKDELKSDGDNTFIQYRNEKRFVESIEKLSLPTDNNESLIKTNGTYIIIGGLGNIGLLLADFLSQSAACNIILLSRASFLSKDTWGTALASDNTENSVKAKLQVLQNIQDRGCTTDVFTADVSNQESLHNVFDSVQKKFGAINGVVHSAVIKHEEIFRPVRDVTVDSCKKQWVAKVRGTQVLANVIDKYPVDFCLCMSSLSSTLGGLGLAVYGAANRFIDYFVNTMNQSQDKTRWLSIAWDGWSKSTSDNDISLGRDLLISKKEGMQCFRTVFTEQCPSEILVSTHSLEQRYKKWRTKKLLKPSALPQHVANFQGDTEDILLRMLQEFLQDDSVSMDDDFFALGGDSMLAVSFIDTINRELAVNLSVSVLMEARSVRQLTELITGQYDGDKDNLPFCLVPMRSTKQKNTEKMPLFLVHPVGGTVYFYNDLVTSLESNQPVYGLQARGLDKDVQADTDLRIMAAAYIEAIRQVQPHGPYFLGGASLGGMIAFEIAQQLKHAGETIGHIFLIDSPSEGHMPTGMSALDDVIHYLLSVGEGMTIDKQTISGMDEQEKLDFLSDNLSDVPESFKQQQALIMRIFNANFEVMMSYKLNPIDQIRGVFFAPEEVNDYHPVNLDKPWNTVFLSGMDVIRVKGNHLTMNKSPNVNKIAGFIQLYLNSYIPHDVLEQELA